MHDLQWEFCNQMLKLSVPFNFTLLLTAVKLFPLILQGFGIYLFIFPSVFMLHRVCIYLLLCVSHLVFPLSPVLRCLLPAVCVLCCSLSETVMPVPSVISFFFVNFQQPHQPFVFMKWNIVPFTFWVSSVWSALGFDSDKHDRPVQSEHSNFFGLSFSLKPRVFYVCQISNRCRTISHF